MSDIARPVVDLYSDTQTRPTAAMREAMLSAEVGDEQQRADPTVNRLCERVAAELGQEAALLLPTGTMCNLVAVAVHTSPGDAVVMDRLGHILRSETGGSAVVSSVATDLVDGDRGIFTAAQLAPTLEPGNQYRPPPRLVCLEQTHNFGGGTVWPLDSWREVAELSHARGVPVHADGARLYNAVVATGIPAATWGAAVDSIWIDFTKGLGAPLGAVLAGPTTFIEAAWMWKHRLGGAMRQAGMNAAACLYALDHHVDRLADDHHNARVLGAGLAELGLHVEPVVTNMVWIHPAPSGQSAAGFAAGLADHGVRVSTVGDRVRAVTHLDITAEDVQTALRAAAQVV